MDALYLSLVVWLNDQTDQICTVSIKDCISFCSDLRVKNFSLYSKVDSCKSINQPIGMESREIEEFLIAILTLAEALNDPPTNPGTNDSNSKASGQSPSHPWLDAPRLPIRPNPRGTDEFKGVLTQSPPQLTGLSASVPEPAPLLTGQALSVHVVPNDSTGFSIEEDREHSIKTNEPPQKKPTMSESKADILQGVRGEASLTYEKQIDSQSSKPLQLAFKSNRIDLNKFLPHLSRNLSSINGKSQDIFERVSIKFIEKCKLGTLLECK